MPSRNPMPRLCAASTHIKHHGIRSPRNPNAWSAKMSSALQPIPSSIPLPNFLITPKEPFVSAWKRLWSMRQVITMISQTIQPLPQLLPRWMQLCERPALEVHSGFCTAVKEAVLQQLPQQHRAVTLVPLLHPYPPPYTQAGVAGRLYAGRRCSQKTLSSKK